MWMRPTALSVGLAIAALCPPANAEETSVRLSAPTARFYGGIEYLNWWVKDAPLAVPLLATGPDEEPIVGGFLKGPDAKILYGAPGAPATGGKDTQALPLFSGARITLGTFLDDAHTYAVEGSAFLLEQRGAGYTAYGDGTGNPPMRIPVYNNAPYHSGGVGLVVTPQEDGVPVALPDDLSGRVTFKNRLRFWGAEAAGVRTLYRDANWELSALGGFRYLNLAERFSLRLEIEGFQGSPFAGQSGWAADEFKTGNQFFGGTLGMRGRYRYGPFSVEATGKLGVGLSHETESISGAFQDFNTPAVTGLPGAVSGLRSITEGPNGIFAQPSNSGRRSTDAFAVVPEFQVKLGYDLTDWARLTVGYDFIYWSNVLRPTDQIDRNFSKGLPFLQDAAANVGPTRKFRQTDFYAQGLSVGVSFRF